MSRVVCSNRDSSRLKLLAFVKKMLAFEEEEDGETGCMFRLCRSFAVVLNACLLKWATALSAKQGLVVSECTAYLHPFVESDHVLPRHLSPVPTAMSLTEERPHLVFGIHVSCGATSCGTTHLALAGAFRTPQVL